jgi:hypothetical protein
MVDYVYRSYADLEALGNQVVEKAAEVTLWQDESYNQAQQDSVNDFTKSHTPVTPTKNPHYAMPTSGDPTDAENIKAYVRSALADLPRYFTVFSVPDPDSINDAITTPFYRTAGTLVPSLRLTRKNGDGHLTTDTLAGSDSTAESVNEMLEFITTIHMKHWTGDAANAFTGYCLMLKQAVEIQHQFAISLAEVMDAHLELRRRQLTDVWNIGEKTIQALDALDSWCNRKKTIQNVLTVVGAIAAVVVVVATEGAVAPVAAEGVQSLAAILGTIPDRQEEPADISGATVQAVVSSMYNVIQKLHTLIDEQEQQLQRALQTLQTVVHGAMPTLLVEPPTEFTGLSSVDIDTLRTIFIDR